MSEVRSYTIKLIKQIQNYILQFYIAVPKKKKIIFIYKVSTTGLICCFLLDRYNATTGNYSGCLSIIVRGKLILL